MIVLGLGSNLGDKQATLLRAIDIISDKLLSNVIRSEILGSKALMPANAPETWDMDFANMAIAGENKHNLTPENFLNTIKLIEEQMGRTPAERWAPRVIDIDILAWGDEVIELPNLTIPHAELHKRDFAKLPFLEILPNWVHPRFQIKLSEL